ncbi:palmitoyltransferase ZDHHC19 [Tiliqua scincoides]|uniref:palmitoyltransferase ZDHHC19 n=1 Tax=Tiliqua scincoides TaxID=71010 RepID=UPI003462C70A
MGPSHPGCPYLASSLFASFHFSTLLCLSCLFFTFPCSWLALHVSWAFPIVCGLFFILTLIYFLLTSFTDTGILHRGTEEKIMNQVLTMKDLNLHWCNQCQLYCLPRTFHCSWCNTCVEEFSHHCMWLNNCIGYHNLRFFFLFVAFLSGYDLAVLISCLAYIVLNNFQTGFNTEKICTVLVTIPAAFYLVPLFVLLYTQMGYIFAATRKCKCQTRCTVRHALHERGKPDRWWRHPWTWNSAPHNPHGLKYSVRTDRPAAKATILKDGRASQLRRTPHMASFSIPAAGSSLGGSCPHKTPREQKVVKAWRHFLSAVGNLLRRRGTRLGAPTEHAAKSGGKRKTGWQLNTNSRSMEIPTMLSFLPVPDMLDSFELLDEEQNTHWKCQIHLNRRAPSSPTATLLSVSDI